MPRRPKRRLDHLVDALEAASKVGVSLNEIELRTCSTELKELVKSARAAQRAISKDLHKAVSLDVPAAPRLSGRPARAD